GLPGTADREVPHGDHGARQASSGEPAARVRALAREQDRAIRPRRGREGETERARASLTPRAEQATPPHGTGLLPHRSIPCSRVEQALTGRWAPAAPAPAPMP